MTFAIGAIGVTRIEQSLEPIAELSYLFPTVTAEAIARNLAWLEPHFVEPATQRYVLSIHSWLVRTPHRTILIDACSGNHKQRLTSTRHHGLNVPFLERLAAAGCRPADVDVVFCTHLHVDHVGWNTRLDGDRWVPTFPNARYLFARADYAAMDPANPAFQAHGDNAQIFADSIAPVVEAQQAVLVDDGYDVDGTFVVQAAVGHTPGHFAVRAASNGARAIFSGDAMHHPIQIAEPDLNSRYCRDPDAARAARRTILEACAETGALLLPAHFGAPHAGHITAHASTFAFTPAS